MKIQYIGKNINVRDNFKTEVAKKLERLDKYFENDVEAKASFSVHGNFNTAEVTIWLKKGTILRAEETSDEMLISVDRVVDSLDRQIRKYKTKLQSRKSNESIRYEEVPMDETTLKSDKEPKVVKVKSIGLKPMFIEDAIMQMELLGHNFFVFRDAELEAISVVYKRKDGDYAIITEE